MASLRVRLAEGVAIGEPGNPTVYVPDRGTFILDDTTHTYLLKLAPSDGPRAIASQDRKTIASLARLSNAGIIEAEGLEHPPAPQSAYSKTLADLQVKKTSRLLTAILRGIASAMSWGMTAFVASVLTLVMVGASLAWLVDGPAELVARTWITSPIVCLAAVAAAQSIRLILHEAGHLAAAKRAGVRASAGVGIYITGPVMYVDLSALDTQSLRRRLAGDLGGTAVDGAILATLLGSFLVAQNGVMACVLASLSGAALASLHPMTKSDGYWALRDLFNARALPATWASPKSLWRAARPRSPLARGSVLFSRVLIAIYLAFGLTTIAVAPRWGLAFWKAIQDADAVSLLLAGGTAGVYLMAAAYGVVRNRRAKSRTVP